MESHALAFKAVAAFAHDGTDFRVEGVRETYVADHAAFEECEWADSLGAVDDLVGDDEVAGFDGFLEAAYSGEGDDGADAEVAEGGDVGASGDFVGGELVMEAMAGDEGDGDWLACGGRWVVEDGDGRGGSAPGSAWVEGGDVGEVREGLESCAANDGDRDGVCHMSVSRAMVG